jgi:hypothetical protein
MKTGTLLAIILFVLVAVAHLIRLIDRTDIMVGTMVLPLWASVLGVVVPGLIAWLLWKESK